MFSCLSMRRLFDQVGCGSGSQNSAGRRIASMIEKNKLFGILPMHRQTYWCQSVRVSDFLDGGGARISSSHLSIQCCGSSTCFPLDTHSTISSPYLPTHFAIKLFNPAYQRDRRNVLTVGSFR